MKDYHLTLESSMVVVCRFISWWLMRGLEEDRTWVGFYETEVVVETVAFHTELCNQRYQPENDKTGLIGNGLQNRPQTGLFCLFSCFFFFL